MNYKTPIIGIKQILDPKKNMNQYINKQRIVDRMNESIRAFLPENSSELDEKQIELLNIIFNYVDLYDSNANFTSDSRYKFVYTMHVLNHVLK